MFTEKTIGRKGQPGLWILVRPSRNGILSHPGKVNLIRTLPFRCFRLCSSPLLLRSSLEELKMLLPKTATPVALLTTILMMSTKQTKITQQPWYLHGTQKKKFLSTTLFRVVKQNYYQTTQGLYKYILWVHWPLGYFPKHTSHHVSVPLQRQAQPFSNVQSCI